VTSSNTRQFRESDFTLGARHQIVENQLRRRRWPDAEVLDINGPAGEAMSVVCTHRCPGFLAAVTESHEDLVQVRRCGLALRTSCTYVIAIAHIIVEPTSTKRLRATSNLCAVPEPFLL